jgi:hypothetical protein
LSLTPGHFGELHPRDSRFERYQRETTNIQTTGEKEDQFDPVIASPIPSFGVVHRHRGASSQSLIVALVKVIIGGFFGLAAGYFVLCVIDGRNDFLHLIDDNDAPAHQDLAGESLPLRGSDAPKNLKVPPANPPIPQPRRNNRIPKVVPPVVPIPKQVPARDPPRGQPIELDFNPFADLPDKLSIPTPLGLQVSIALMSVPLEQLNNFELALVDEPGAKGAEISLERVLQNAPWTWIVRTIGDGATEVASFTIKNNDLQFTWSDVPDTVGVSALRNSVLKMRANGHEHFLALRTPSVVKPHIFDLNKVVDRITCDCEHVPDATRLRVDILGLQNCPAHEIQGNGLLGLKLNTETILKYRSPSGAATKIKFVSVKDRPTIEFESRYQLPSGAQDSMEIRRGNRKLNILRRANDPKQKADLLALERIAQLARQLHENASVRYRFYSVVGGREVVIAETP